MEVIRTLHANTGTLFPFARGFSPSQTVSDGEDLRSSFFVDIFIYYLEFFFRGGMKKAAPEPLFVLRTQRVEVTSLAFYEKEELLSGGQDGSVTLWCLKSRRAVKSWQAHHQTPLCSFPAVQSLTPLRSGVLSQGRDGFAHLWNLGERSEGASPLFSIETSCCTFATCSVIELNDPIIVSEHCVIPGSVPLLAIPSEKESNEVNTFPPSFFFP